MFGTWTKLASAYMRASRTFPHWVVIRGLLEWFLVTEILFTSKKETQDPPKYPLGRLNLPHSIRSEP